jgi:hypothetical protein
MTNETDPSEWPYSEFGSHPTPKMDIERISNEAKWGSGDFGRDFDDEDSWQEWIDEVLESSEGCTCNPDKIYSAASDLIEYFSQHGRFPRTMAQIDSFASPGGWAHGSWSKFINVPSSVPYEPGEIGSIHIFGCWRSGHGCRIEIDDELVPFINGDKSTFMRSITPDDSSDDDSYEDAKIAAIKEAVREADEELAYDDRTFGALVKEDVTEDDDEPEFIKLWQDEAFPPVGINAYVEAGLEIQEVLLLGRFMPLSEVALWAEKFGTESMLALDLLRVGIGDMPLTEEIRELDFDDLRSEIAAAIRNAIIEEFENRKDDFRIIEKKTKKEEPEEDLEEDLDFLDELDDDDDDYVLDDFRTSREIKDFLKYKDSGNYD